MSVFRTSAGERLELLVTGTGEPTTVFAHGLGGSIATTRPFASGVRGTKVFPHARGHGASSRGPMTYEGLAEDLLEIADAHGATRALGVSMGAGALTRLLADAPDRFERVVLVLPAVLDGGRAPETLAYWERVWTAEDPSGVLAEEIPAELRETAPAREFVREQAAAFTNRRGRRLLMELAGRSPLADASVLAKVTAPVLVIGCEGDPRHPASVARRAAELLPSASAHVYPEPGIMWRYRGDLRARVSSFLN